jgi:RNA recognition motif-containing protein
MAEDKKLLSVYEREGRNTSSQDPKMLNSRVFIGNLAAEKVGRQDIESMFAVHGKVLGVSLHKSYGFVQFDSEESAKNSVNAMQGHMLHGLKMGKFQRSCMKVCIN